MGSFETYRCFFLHLILYLVIPGLAEGQESKYDSLYLIDRKPQQIEFIRSDDELFYFKKPGKKREQEVELTKVYGYRSADGVMHVLYVQDTLEGNWYTAEQMQFYMQGQSDALKHYKRKASRAGWLGFATGFAGSAAGIYYAPVIAVGYASLRAYIKPSNKQKWGFNPALADNEAYTEGFGTMAKRLTTRRSALGATVGFVVGTVSLTLILSQ